MGLKENSKFVNAAIEQLIADGKEIGVQVAAYLNAELVVDCATGTANVETGKQVTNDTLFNVYSVTKAVAVTALHMQVDRGHIAYDSLVADFWPEFACKGKEKTIVRDIITHRGGIPQMPEGVTPELICDRDWMLAQLANLEPLAPPGEKALYHSMTFGWLIDKLVQASDPQNRTLSQFVKEDIAGPLNAPDLWIGLPDSELPRVATLVNADPAAPPEMLPPLFLASMPPEVSLVPEVFELANVRQAQIAGVGGIFTAKSCARFWAMLAQGGELDGVRLLSEELVRTFNTPRDRADEPDLVMFGGALPLSIAGYWLGGDQPPVASPKHSRAICHPGAGNSIGWADPDTKLAVAICHNRMHQPMTREDDSILVVADAIRETLGLD